MSADTQKKVVILGGGFGGVYAALELDKALAHDPSLKVILVSSHNYFLFTPMLAEVAASDLEITSIVSPIRQMLRRVEFLEGSTKSVDLDSKKVVVTHGCEQHEHTLDYDHLLICLGGVTNFYNLPGLADNALTMKSLGDAILLRNQMIARLEAAELDCFAGSREPELTFVVAGAGFAGVETIGAINDFLRESVKFYPSLNEDMLRVVLVHDMATILPELSEQLGKYAHKKLSERKVEVRLGNRVTGYSEGAVHLSDGTSIKTNTLVWTAGVAANPLIATLACKKERGRIAVNEYLEVPGFPGVWALGDCSMVPDVTNGKFCPPTAQHAMRQGKVAAQNIIASMRGEKTKAFKYATMGQLAAIGKRTGVANMLGLNISGFLAWVMWRTIYLIKLPRFEKKLRVALGWTLDLFFPPDLVQFGTVRGRTISEAED